MRITTLLALALGGAFGACSDGEERPPKERAPAPSRDQPAAPAVPDGGVPEGHGADDEAPPPRERGSIVVPETDPTPPRPVVRLAGARATLDQGAPRVLVSKNEPIAVTVVGRDRDGGMGRARVAIRARLTCRSTAGKVATRPLVRYVPPPQVERIRIAPGTRIRTELRQTVTQRFDTTDCMGGTLERFSGQAWADTTNASGLDATSKHIHFGSR
ncbi:MAG: hypothetical protein ICV69_15220 [Thermoleophilaceae bacterium]|nr:hypothetical protein [Thermoleophilaceae bacterium]